MSREIISSQMVKGSGMKFRDFEGSQEVYIMVLLAQVHTCEQDIVYLFYVKQCKFVACPATSFVIIFSKHGDSRKVGNGYQKTSQEFRFI